MTRTMKGFFQWTLGLSLIVLTLVGPSKAATTVAVISIKPTDQVFEDINYLTKATGTDQLAQFFLPQVKGFFEGIDGKRPIGVAIQLDDAGAVGGLAFLPVTDFETVMTQIESQMGARADAGNGIYELRGPQTVFVKEQGGWAFFSQSTDGLQDLPAAPEKWLESLPSEYVISVRAFLKDVPQPYKEMAISQMQAGLEGNIDPDDPSAKAAAEAQVAQVTQLLTESDTVTIGWQIDAKQRQSYFDFTLKPIAETELANQIDAMRDAKTNYAGFMVKDAAIQMNMCSKLLPEQITESIQSLDTFEASTLAQIDEDADINEGTRAGAKKLVETFFEVARSTVKTGNFDSCASVILKPKAMTIVSASHVASGSDVEAAVKQLIAISQNEPELTFNNVKFNAEEHAGVRLHTMELPIPEEEYVRRVMGETLKIVVGASDESAYLSLGDDPLNTLKKLVDDSQEVGETTVDPFHVQIAMLPILKFAQSVEPNPMINALTQMLGNAEGVDRILLGTTLVDDSARYRFTLEEGVLQLIGQGAQVVGMAQGGGF